MVKKARVRNNNHAVNLGFHPMMSATPRINSRMIMVTENSTLKSFIRGNNGEMKFSQVSEKVLSNSAKYCSIL